MEKGDRRQKKRRGDDRRQVERRRNPHDFGSREWLETIEDEYALVPKHDRRRQERRKRERRAAERRTGDRRRERAGKRERQSERESLYELDKEEREMLQEILGREDEKKPDGDPDRG